MALPPLHNVREYLATVAEYSNDGIDANELQNLYSLAETSSDPEVKLLFKALVSGGSFVTRYNSKVDANICLNFSGSPKDLYCNKPSLLTVFGYNALETISVKPASVEFTDSTARSDLSVKSSDWLKIGRDISAIDAIKIIQEHAANTTLVEHLIAQLFDQTIMPESASAISYALFNIFSQSDSIDAETKQLYGDLIKRGLEIFRDHANKLAEMTGNYILKNSYLFDSKDLGKEGNDPILCRLMPSDSVDFLKRIGSEIATTRQIISLVGSWLSEKTNDVSTPTIAEKWDGYYLASISPLGWSEQIKKWADGKLNDKEIADLGSIYLEWFTHKINDNFAYRPLADLMSVSGLNAYAINNGTVFDNFWDGFPNPWSFGGGFLGGQFLIGNSGGIFSQVGNALIVLPIAAAASTVHLTVKAMIKSDEHDVMLPDIISSNK